RRRPRRSRSAGSGGRMRSTTSPINDTSRAGCPARLVLQTHSVQSAFPMITGTTKAVNDRHVAELRESGLTDTTIRDAGIYSESDPARIAELLGWARPA